MTDPALRQAIDRTRPALVIIDPLQAYLGGADMHRAEELRAAMAALAELARERACAVLILQHLRKSTTDHAIHRGAGRYDLAAVARAVLMAGRDPADPTRRALASIARRSRARQAPQSPDAPAKPTAAPARNASAGCGIVPMRFPPRGCQARHAGTGRWCPVG